MDQLRDSIAGKVQERQERFDRLDAKVTDFSRALAREEAKNAELFITNAYFMKMSGPDFERLSSQEQLMFLALWAGERARSAPGNVFTVECRKLAHGITIDFVVTLRRGGNLQTVALLFGAAREKRRMLEAVGFSVMTPDPDAWRNPAATAEEVFAFLERRADARAWMNAVLKPRPL
jgi:hypothetical protein